MVRIRAARRRDLMADSATQEDQCHQKKIFVGGLTRATTTQDLRDYFERYGAVVQVLVPRTPDGRSRGFGYVTFAGQAAADAALKQVVHQVKGCGVDVKRAVPGTNKLFIGGLPQNATASELREHFEQFGVVSDAVVMMDPNTCRSRGFGFVCFLPCKSGALAAAAALDQANHRIRSKWIEVKSAAPPHKLVVERGRDAMPNVEDNGRLCFAQTKPLVVGPPDVQPVASGFSIAEWNRSLASWPLHAAASGKPQALNLAEPHPHNAPQAYLGPLGPSSARSPLISVMGCPCSTLPSGEVPDPIDVQAEACAALQVGLSKQEQDACGAFDASRELRQSLEQLLRLHFKCSDGHVSCSGADEFSFYDDSVASIKMEM